MYFEDLFAISYDTCLFHYPGCTPLHYAAANGYVTTVRYLLETGDATLGAKTKKGHTARHMAKTRAQTKMVAFLNEIG